MSATPQRISILGSTGSIGVSTLRVIEAHPRRYRVHALTAKASVDTLYQQCLRFTPRYAVLAGDAEAARLRLRLAAHQGLETEVLSGASALAEVASSEAVDCVMAAIVGGAGLLPTLAAARAGKKVLLANKEALVMAGDLFMAAARQSRAQLLPIDSEHNAIFQCLPINERGCFENRPGAGFEKILLTASGGPFLHTPLEALGEVTPEQACAHPNWAMGQKISVDSATLLNKSLELIEACYLFDVPERKVDIVIHPQSIVHSMVYYRDGSVLAQMGNPDMRTPIAYGLAWPERMDSGVAALDLVEAGRLEFLAPDEGRFPCLRLGRQAARAQGTAAVILNAANEVAVQAFLDRRLGFAGIPVIIEEVLNHQAVVRADDLDTVLAEDTRARRYTEELVRRQAA